MRLNTNLKRLRSIRGLSQKRVAQLTGLTRNMIHNYEAGYTEPRICTLVKLAQFYKVTVDELIV